MLYFVKGMELEVIWVAFHGSVNDVVVCRDRASSGGTTYALLVVHDSQCKKQLLTIFENSGRFQEEPPYLFQFSQNEDLCFAFPYREARRFSAFSAGQMTSANIGETICINLVMECLSSSLPWPLLYLILSQDSIHIAKDNEVYFIPIIDLSKLDPKHTEANCVSRCARLILKLLSKVYKGSKSKKQLKSFRLIEMKCKKSSYNSFPELYHDIKVTSLPIKKPSLIQHLRSFWINNGEWMFRVLVILAAIALISALLIFVSQVLFGDIPLLRIFSNTFDVIGTENLHQ